MYQIIKSPILNEQIGIRRLEDSAHIPINPDNVDYQQYLKWLAEGNQPLPADE